MQPVAGRRALGYIASKLHPRAPLTPRESAQLLTLLTTSFRAHLDKAHPVAEAESDRHGASKKSLPPASRRRARSVPPAHVSLSEHIDSILSSPLFTTPPGRRASDASKADAQSALRDPLGWFLGQVALGAADLAKAESCVHMLKTDAGASNRKTYRLNSASRIANWLQSSGPNTWSQFMSYRPEKLLSPLTQLLLREGDNAIAWNWFVSASNMQGTVDEVVMTFRSQVLRAIVYATTSKDANSIDDGLSAFLRAHKMVESSMAKSLLTPAGLYLVHTIAVRPNFVASARLYEDFLGTVPKWSGHHRTIQTQSLLWLRHPKEPTALPALAYIKDHEGAERIQSKGKRKFFVHLCLGAARQLLAEEKYQDAQFALEFARDNFPDLVEPQLQLASEEEEREHEAAELRRKEDAALKILDGLFAT